MDFNVTREQWVERFAMHLARLEIGAEPADFAALANRLWDSRGQVEPETAADDEFVTRLRASSNAGADGLRAFEPQSTSMFERTEANHRLRPPEPASESRFERTERIPVERVNAAGEYVRDNDEWIARCLGRVLELDPIIKAEEARRSVTELAGLERWRLMKPEAAAEQLYTPIRPNG